MFLKIFFLNRSISLCNELLVMLMHSKSPYTVPRPAAWIFLFLHMYSICEAFAQFALIFLFMYR